MFRSWQAVAALAASAATGGCGSDELTGADPAGGEGSENVGSVMFELTSIPSGVGCVRISAVGSMTVSKDFSLSMGSSTASLALDRLPLGSLTIDGSAYPTTCGTGSPAYLADTATTSIAAGVVTTVSLTFRKNNPVTANANFVGNVQAVSAQRFSTYALIDGTVYYWGRDVTQAAGTVSSLVPTPIAGLTGVVDLAQGYWSETPCALKADGSMWCWGDNAYGQVGVASPARIVTPIQFGADKGYAIAASGKGHVCGALPLQKVVKCAGLNDQGQLGNNTTTNSSTILSVAFASVSSLSAGVSHTCVIKRGLDVTCWGRNTDGQLGDGTTTRQTSAETGLPAFGLGSSVSTQYSSTCALIPDGTVRCWGYNANGELGDGTTTQRLTAFPVSGLSGVAKLVTGASGGCALLTGGTVKCWGDNSVGEVGDGTVVDRFSPVAVNGLPAPVVQLTGGLGHFCAVTAKQDIYCWGDNTAGQLGDGGYNHAIKPVKVRLP